MRTAPSQAYPATFMTCPTVVLRHQLPDGSYHFDWLISPKTTGSALVDQQPLISFRLPTPPHELQPQQTLPALRLGDHRPLYLSYEGRLPGPSDRGSVKRIAVGGISNWIGDETGWRMDIAWMAPDSRSRLELVPDGRKSQQDAATWTVRCFDPTPEEEASIGASTRLVHGGGDREFK